MVVGWCFDPDYHEAGSRALVHDAGCGEEVVFQNAVVLLARAAEDEEAVGGSADNEVAGETCVGGQFWDGCILNKSLEAIEYEGVLTYQFQGPSRGMEYDPLLCGVRLQHGTLHEVPRPKIYV